MRFKEFYTNRKLIGELSHSSAALLPSNVKQLLADKKLPFNEIFGDKLRIVSPLKGGKEYKANISKHFTDTYNIDFDKWVGYKLSDTEKKNPVRIGKLLNKRKVDLERAIKSPEYPDNAKAPWIDMVQQLDALIKTTNLQKQTMDAESTSLFVVCSRAPVDVARMGDMDFKSFSCHAEGGDYFYCALADAMLNAGVAYLISEEDYEVNRLDIDENLQQDEIFLDPQRDVDGMSALARIRIRLVLDGDGNELAVPVTKIYAKTGYEFNDDFKEHMIKWAKAQDVSNFKWDTTLSLRGGTYEDAGVSIENQVKLIWGKDVRYQKTPSDEADFRDEYGDGHDDYEEEAFYDNVRDELRQNEDVSIFEELFESEHWSSDSNLDITLRHGSRIGYKFTIPDDVVERIGLDKLVAKDNTLIGDWKLRILRDTICLLEYQDDDAINLFDHGEFYNNRFEFEDYYKEVRKSITSTLDGFAPVSTYNATGDLPYCYRSAFISKILTFFNVAHTEVSADDITEFLDGDYQFAEIDLLDYILPFSYSRPDSAVLRANSQYTISDLEFEKLKSYYDYVTNWIWDTLEEKSGGLLSEVDFDLESTLIIGTSGDHGKVKLFNSADSMLPVEIDHTGTHDGKAYMSFKLRFKGSDELISLIDKNKVEDVSKFLGDLIYALDDDDDSVNKYFKVKKLDSGIKNVSRKAYRDDLKAQGQLELDLASINRYMSKNKTVFDSVVHDMLLELNYGTGGIANGGMKPQSQQQQPVIPTTTGVQGGTQMKFAGQPKYASTTPGATQVAAAGQNPQQGQTQQNPQQDVSTPEEISEFEQFLQSRKSANGAAAFNKAASDMNTQDPVKFGRFLNFITQSSK